MARPRRAQKLPEEALRDYGLAICSPRTQPLCGLPSISARTPIHEPRTSSTLSLVPLDTISPVLPATPISSLSSTVTT